MDQPKPDIPPDLRHLADILDDALRLLDSDEDEGKAPLPACAIQPSLFEQCIELCRQGATLDAEPVRTIHQLSCTGGTLIAKCLAAMPNVMLLNEVDPLSTIPINPEKPVFTPTDLLSLVRQGNQKVGEDIVIGLFLQNLGFLRNEYGAIGKRLVLRDHSHSHFLVGPEIPNRPSLLSIVRRQFPTLSAVTVRHPIDSYLSMQEIGWHGHFHPTTFDEYCRRYLAFLDAYEGLPVFRYEDFVKEPLAVMPDICQALGLGYSDTFVDTFNTFALSGDSGRKGDVIAPRDRRPSGDALTQLAKASENYGKLVHRLGYPPE